MTIAPEAAYISNSERTEGQTKQFLEDLLSLIKEAPGGQSETELTIDSGSVTATSALHRVDTENDTSADDLTNISPDNHPGGRLLLIRADDDDRTVTVKHENGGEGQILLIGGADITLTTDRYLWLVQRSDVWHQVSLAGLSGTTLVPKGEWSSIVTYATGDLVERAGSVFASRIDDNLNDAPVVSPPADSVSWMLLPTIAGADGTPVNLDDLLDVGASHPEHGDILRYDSDTDEWIKYNSQVWQDVSVVGGEATIDFLNKDKFMITVTEDCELKAPLNAVAGAPFVIRVLMDGSHSFTYEDGVFLGALPPVLVNDGDETILSGLVLDVQASPQAVTVVVNLVKQIQA